MIEYRVEFYCITRYGSVLFRIAKYYDGKHQENIGNYYSAVEAEAYVREILKGEKTFVVLPRTVKEITFNC